MKFSTALVLFASSVGAVYGDGKKGMAPMDGGMGGKKGMSMSMEEPEAPVVKACNAGFVRCDDELTCAEVATNVVRNGETTADDIVSEVIIDTDSCLQFCADNMNVTIDQIIQPNDKSLEIESLEKQIEEKMMIETMNSVRRPNPSRCRTV